MRYENLLASRYIKAQKRQSIFTVISIAAAIAIMAMVFVLYSVFMNCFRKAVYTSSPYHLEFKGITSEQGEAFHNEEHIKSLRLEDAPDGTVTAYIMFGSNIGDRDHWLQRASRETGTEEQYKNDQYKWNNSLMRLDLIDDGAHLWRLRIFCVFFIFAVLFALALRLVVDTAFEISSKERERHYGVLQSIGATPQQIVKIITFEGMRLCLIAIPFGLAAGIATAYLMFRALLAADLSDIIHGMTSEDFSLSFSVDPKMLLISALVGAVWVFLSSYGVGMRVIRKAPMEAITSRADDVKKVKKHTLSGRLFGISGSIASRNARRQKKRFLITVVTLTVSITMFAIFTTLSDTIEHSISKSISASEEMNNSDFSLFLNYDEDPEKQLADSGLFRDIRISECVTFNTDKSSLSLAAVEYVNEEEYKALFGNDPPVSYEELVSSGGYILNKSFSELAAMKKGDTVSITTERYTRKADQPDSYTDDHKMNFAYDTELCPHEISITAEAEIHEEQYRGFIVFVSAIPTYYTVRSEWFGDIFQYSVMCSLSSAHENIYTTADHDKILEYFKNNSDRIELNEDLYKEKLDVHNIMSSIRAGVLIFNVIIALTALINLLNIISTGIANRRSELASLQCIGMTDRQLYCMTAIECLQFTVTAALISAAICGAVILGTEHFLPQILMKTYADDGDVSRDMLNDAVHLDHISPFIRIALASAAAFAAGCITSLLMLRSQNTDSLSDQIRGSELKINTNSSQIR